MIQTCLRVHIMYRFIIHLVVNSNDVCNKRMFEVVLKVFVDKEFVLQILKGGVTGDKYSYNIWKRKVTSIFRFLRWNVSCKEG